MKRTQQVISIGGLVATMAAATYMVARMDAQGTTAADFTRAANAEVRDAQGQVLLRGEFILEEEEDDDTERKAALRAAGLDADAVGEAEVEYSNAAVSEQEVEFSVRNLEPGTTVTFVIDGVDVGTATIDQRGRAALELDVKLPAAVR